MLLSFFWVFFLFVFFFFHPSRWNFFDEKDLKNGDEEVQPRVLCKVTAYQRKERQMMMSKYISFPLLFFYENTYIPKKNKKKTIISSISPPSSIYQSIDRTMKLFGDVVQTHTLRITCCRTDASHAVVQMDHFLSYDLATYLNCFLMAFPSISTNLKVFVAEVESPRHLVGFHRPGAFQTVFRLGALTFSTDFLTASRRAKSAE